MKVDNECLRNDMSFLNTDTTLILEVHIMNPSDYSTYICKCTKLNKGLTLMIEISAT